MTLAFLSHPTCLLHEMSFAHPEQPDRLRVIDYALKNSLLSKKIKKFLSPNVTLEQLLRVHTKDYLDHLFQLSPKEGLVSVDPDTWLNPYSLPAAERAAGATILAVDLIMNNEVNAAFCSSRPPGHHAERGKAMGFCFFNNVAVGVAHALEQYKLQRVAIIDFDVHHGNGTEDIFKHDKRVLLCSSFQSPFYPYSGTDSVSDHIVNTPLPPGTTGQELLSKAVACWLPLVEDFAPEMIFFSAGFDGHREDPLANFMLETSDFGRITAAFKKIADKYAKGRIVSTLEGGYCLEVLGECVRAHMEEF